jgi:hypothetical protein
VDRVEARVREPCGGRLELVEARPPGSDRIGLVEPAGVRDLLPQSLERRRLVEIRVDDPRPAGGRARHHRPVDRPLSEHLHALPEERELVAARADGIDAVERAGHARPGERDAGAALTAELEHALAVPGGDELERVVRRELDARALDERVEVRDVDEARSPSVTGGGEGTRQLLLSDVGADRENLAGLDVRAEADGELRQLLEPRLHDEDSTCRAAA